MALIEIVREVALSPAEAWARLTTWPRHGDVVPLTTILPREGGFTARTALGPLHLDDVMDVVAWDPPSWCRVEKRGRVVQGWAELSVQPAGPGARVTWREDVHVRGVPRALAPVEALVARRLFTTTVDHLLHRPR